MRTVPIATASFLLEDHPLLRARLGGCGRDVGARVELDLDAVEVTCPALCRALAAYHSRTTRMWDDIAAGRTPAHDFTVTRRVLAEHRQVTTKVGRRDLGDVFAQLVDVPLISDLVDALTDVAPDPDAIAARAAELGGQVHSSDDGVWVATVPLEGAVAWPDVLGGPAVSTEVARSVTFTVRHAAWRDRRVRRLANVRVEVDELWADPTADRRLLPSDT